MWTRTRCTAGAGRSPRSPGTWAMTARPSAPTCAATGSPAQRRRAEPDPFEPFAGYCRERLAEDPHLWATTLFDELLELGYDRSYPTFTRQLRARGLRPACEPCRPAKGRPVAVIEHPPGEETQWDWLELPDPPAHWGWGSKAFLLVGALAHSGRWRGVLAESTDQPHLIDAPAPGLRRAGRADPQPGGSTGWPPSATRARGQVTASFAAVAKHYGVSVAICPPRRGNRKGVVEKANHTAAQRWWRTLADDVTVEQAQAALGPVVSRCAATPACARPPTARPPWPPSPRAEPLRPAAGAVPGRPGRARGSPARRRWSSFRGNHYSVPPELARAHVTVIAPARRGRHRAGHQRPGSSSPATTSPRPGPAPPSATPDTSWPWNAPRMAAFTTAAPHRRKQRIPPGPAARAAAAALRARHSAPAPSTPDTAPTGEASAEVVVDLARYAAAAQGRNTLR